MEKTSLENVSLSSKESFKLPEGATITKKEVSVRVEEIENGFLISKSYDINYKVGDESSYEYYTKKFFSKDNPLADSLSEIEEATSLADSFE